MHLARAVATDLLISPQPAGCRNGDRRSPLLDWLGGAVGRARRRPARS